MGYPDVTVALDGRGGTDPFRNGMDVGQEPTASGPPMSGLLIGGSGHRNGECS
jgi:hypothetical protein